MAVIGKIREKSTLVMVIVGVAMLAFLLPTDGVQNLFGGQDTSVGEIGGEMIDGQDFDRRLEEAITSWENQNQTAASTEVRESFREQVWNTIIREYVLESQFAELGLAVSPEELFDMVQGNDPHPQVKQAFTDPNTGIFNPSQVLQFLKSLETMPAENRNQWLLFEEGIEKERISTKYNTLLAKGLYATTSMARQTYKEQNEQRNVKFVVKRYNTVHDSTIQVTDEELKAYYQEHKNEYKQDASRDIEYVRFDVTPSQEDITEAKEWIERTAEEFKTTDDDSSFVVYNSEEPLDENYYGANAMPAQLDSMAFYAEKGTLFPVYEDNGSFVVAKLTDAKMVPDSVKARHILLKTTMQPTDTLLEARLDSIKGVIEKGGDFATIAKEVSEDVGSAIEGGDLGWFTEGMMVKPFNDACFNGKVGDLVIVQSQFGFHLIEIQAQAEKSRKVQLAKVVRKITPSNETFDAVFAKASSFFSANNSSEAFTKATEGGEYMKRVATEIKAGDRSLPGITEARDIIRWAFKSEKGTVSEPKQFDDVFIVAHVSEVREDGIATMDQVAIQVELGAKKKKKAEMFTEEMKGIMNLEELAGKLNLIVESAGNVNFAAYAVPGMGQEPQVIGKISTIPQGQMTATPVEGQTGVFVVLVESVTPAPETTDYSAIKDQLQQSYMSNTSRLMDALKDKFGVVDKRYKYY
ncbi:MAG: SurA N-terminal domain-containing protein [Flavobacteriales bacterium]|nr:SurA N-terminal domain-containing protein [Flavobacteriales bacterium]